jgi:cytochrome c553
MAPRAHPEETIEKTSMGAMTSLRLFRSLPLLRRAGCLVAIAGLMAMGSGAAAVDFATQVHPILAARCATCHNGDKPPSGLSFANRASALKGGAGGPAFTPGDSEHSLMILKVTKQKGGVMPPVGEPLSAEQISILKAWIDEGAVWPDAPSETASRWVAPIDPKHPMLPEGSEPNPIDRFMAAYFAQHHVDPPASLSDAVYARRVYFAVWGLPPTPAQLQKFLDDKDPQKRQRLVDSLLANNELYAENWISWWNDLLRNDIGTNYQGERKSITPWLIGALRENMPYDKMVSALVNPVDKNDPDGFLIGVNWRGTVNASQTPYMQAAQNTGQVFLGINLKCASCHDSFVNKYKLRQSYGMAALFSPDSRLELVRCDVKQGKFVTPALLYPELGSVPENASLAERHAAAAKFFTNPQNGRVPRTIVNRYWQKLFGRGLVEPVDDMDSQPWNADLLDWLASDFVAHGNDLHYLVREMLTSKAYQMPTVVSTERVDKAYVFRGPYVRRLTAEEFADTVAAITGEWRTRPEESGAVRVRDWELKSSPLSLALGRPLRDQVYTTRDNHATTFQALELVNGATLEKTLHRGSLRLLDQLPPAPNNVYDSGIIRKGSAAFGIDISGAKQLWLLTENAGSYDPTRTVAGWVDVEVSGPGGTKKLGELVTLSKFQEQEITADKQALGKGVTVPLNTKLLFPIEGLGFTRMRGRIAVDDRSQPNDIAGSVRFFVFTSEPDPDRLVKIEGPPPVPGVEPMKSVDEAINRMYLTAFSRKPTEQELLASRQFFTDNGSAQPHLQPAALQDFLWSMLLHPDFQYVY